MNVEFRVRRKSDLVWLEFCELIDGFHGIRSDYNRLVRASYMVEIAEILFPSNVPSQEMFQLLKTALGCLSNKNNIEEIMIAFGVRALRIGGFGINLSGCIRCGRRYKGEGRALFHPPSGSIACLACERESALTPGMEPAAVDVLQRLQVSEQPVFDNLQFNSKIIKELKSVLAAHLEHCLGKRLKAARYFQ